MIDHIILTVSDPEHSLTFYEAALAPVNIKFFMPYKGENGHPDLWGFGDGKRAFFWLKQGKPDPRAIHWGFMAQNDAKVDSNNEARAMPLAEFIEETMRVLGTDADEVLVERAKPLRNNAGTHEAALVTQFNDAF